MDTRHIKESDPIKFTDRWGEERTIHKSRNGLAVRRDRKTISLHLNTIVGTLVGEKIKAKRLSLGMPLHELCIKSGLTATTPKARMWEIENSKIKEGVRFGTLYSIALALGCEASDLMPTVKEVKEIADTEEGTVTGYRISPGAVQ